MIADATTVTLLTEPAWRAHQAAHDIRAVMFRAEGKVFCGGVDVHTFQKRTHPGGARMMARFLATVSVLETMPVPTLAVVHSLNLTIGFELVRNVAKQESPLVQLKTSSNIISMIATLTFYGADRVGNAIQTTGQITIEFGNFGDQ